MNKKKQNICTLSDYNYLVKGLALYESLIRTNSDFILHYLCLDKESFIKLQKLSLPEIIPYYVEEFVRIDSVLAQLQLTDRWYFCMSLASYFSNFLIKTKNIESIVYADSDIYFHENINDFINNFIDKEVAIFRHRQFNLNESRPEGWFNVGVVYFTNKKFSQKVLSWWNDAVQHRKYPELATCGDQKYLDKFIELVPEDLIYVDGDLGHGAPWQWQLYDLTNYENGAGTIKLNGKNQILYFTHFSQFDFDKNRPTYVPSTMHHIYTPLSEYQNNKVLKSIYDNYFNVLKDVVKKYNL